MWQILFYVYFTRIGNNFLKYWCQGQANGVQLYESGARALAFCKKLLGVVCSSVSIEIFRSRATGPLPLNYSLETPIFGSKMSFASLSQNKSSNHWHHLLWIFSWTYSSWRKEVSVLGLLTRKNLLCPYSILKQTLVWILWPRNKSSGIWKEQMDPRLRSKEECLGNQKNIMVLYKFLVRFQPAALS